MNSTALFELGEPHVRALLERLHRTGRSADAADTCRVYFVDVDVLSTYIDGKNSDVRSHWSSLLSLTPDCRPPRGAPVSSDTQALADATAAAVSGFLLGRFCSGREAQRGRLWMTPEHARELDSMIYAVLREGHEAIGEWQSDLLLRYTELSNPEAGIDDVAHRLDDIFQILLGHAGPGKIARAHDARIRLTTTAVDSPLYPPRGLGQAFLFRGSSDAFQRRVQAIAEAALELLLQNIRSAQNLGYVRAIEMIKRVVFAHHDPKRRMAEYRDIVRRTEAIRALLPEHLARDEAWLAESARIAAKQISDVFSIARLAAIGDTLNEQHPLATGAKWQVCLLSGAPASEQLLGALKAKGLAPYAEVIHPISAMRFDEFLRPAPDKLASKSVAAIAAGSDLPGDEYALRLIADPKKAAESINVAMFLESLRTLLSNAAAGFAPQRDRALRTLWTTLREDAGGYSRLLRVVGNVVSTEFIRTYVQVNRLEQPHYRQLPMISLPWLTLPLAGQTQSAAEQFVERIHLGVHDDTTGTLTLGVAELNQMIGDDPTGYTPCLCAALGYLAMGYDWLQSAENVANTAARTALIAPLASVAGSYVPEGNEALYLAAFVSRMRVQPQAIHRFAAIHWRDSHRSTIQLARERCDKWEREQASVAYQTVNHNLQCTRASLVRLRYDVEDAAREAFCLLIDLLEPAEGERVFKRDAAALAKTLSSVDQQCPRLTDASATVESEVAFIRAQLLVVQIQCWLSFRLMAESTGESDTASAADDLDQLIRASASEFPKNDSALVQGLIAVYRRHSIIGRGTTTSARTKRPMKYTQFAEIDSLRIPFLERLAKLKAGEPLRTALSVEDR